MTGDAVLRARDVTKIFGSEQTEVRAVDRASFEVAAGEFVLIMGPSGSGKTTLLAMCGALMSPTAGALWIGDSEVTSLTEKELPELRLRQLGFIFQSFNLLGNLTARENVALVMRAAGARPRDADARARELLGELGLSARLESRPDDLSGGERQRVAIARALANDPPLILADEPTGNLDSRTGYEVMHMLERLTDERAKTVIAVTHDHRIEDVADRVMWLEDGQLSDSPPDVAEVVRDPVCGMHINAARTAATRTANGSEYCFCSGICVEKFDADPTRYVQYEQ